MEMGGTLVEKLIQYGVGHRKLDDPLFDDFKPSRKSVHIASPQEITHEIKETTCNIPGCHFTAESILEYENHYNSAHRYSCAQCKKMLPSPHLLDLHVQETHDSFFAVMAERKPSYCCYIEECKEKFMNAEERLKHGVDTHKLPKDFRFNQKSKGQNSKKKKEPSENSMEVDRNFTFTNSKQKAFTKYTGKKFTKNDAHSSNVQSVSMDQVMSDLKESLPS